MIDFNKLRHILFLDIETASAVSDYTLLNDRLKPLWDRKASYIDKEADAESLFFEKAGIYAEFGKVVVIGLGKFVKEKDGRIILKVHALANDNEKKLLFDFLELLKKIKDPALKLCAHNGKEFDFPYLARRILINNLQLPPILSLSSKKPWEVPHLDTLEMWRFGDRKAYTSLELLCALFDIPCSKDGMDGSMVNTAYYRENNLTGIAEYCKKDIVATAQLYLKMNGMPLLVAENVVLS